MPYTAEKQTCNKDITVLLFPANNTMTRGKIILRIIALLARNNKTMLSLFHESVSPYIEGCVCPVYTWQGRENK